MVKNPPDGIPRVLPALTYADAPAALEFLCRAFGFETRFRLDMPDGRVGHAELVLEGGVVTLASEFEGFGVSPQRLDGVHSQLMVYVDDVDAHFERARAEGATIAAEPADQFYGARTYRAIDPEGHRWVFATHVRDVPPEEMVPPPRLGGAAIPPAARDSALDATLAALADPVRRGVVELLCEGPRRAGELAEAFALPPPAMSRHLRVLRVHGLVEEDRVADDARVRVYRLRPERFAELQSWLARVESFWSGQLDAFRVHAERRARRRRS